MSKNFNEYRFEGLNYTDASNKYYTMERVNADETKIVVKVASSHLLKTKFGYALILDYDHVVFLKNWQVDINYFGCEVLLTKEFFNVKNWGEFSDFGEEKKNLEWSTWLDVAKAQNAAIDEDGMRCNRVKWAK